MTDMTAEKWAELNAKLEAEAKTAESVKATASGKARVFPVIAIALLGVAGGLLYLLRGHMWAGVLAVPAVLGFVLCVGMTLRHLRTAKQADTDVQRLRDDIRQWKKKRPA